MATALWKLQRRDMQRLNAAALMARGETERAVRLLACVLQDERKEATGYRTWKCQYRHCLFCGWKYWKKFARRYLRKLAKLIEKGYRVSFLTLTVPNILSPQSKHFRWLAAALKKLMRREPFKGRVFAAIARIETDYNSRSQDYHVHIHAILVYTQCPPQKQITEAWGDLTAYIPEDFPLSSERVDNPRLVWIKKINPRAINQTVEYLFKFHPIEEADAFAEYDCAVWNVHLVQAYGALRGRRLQESPFHLLKGDQMRI